MSVPRSPMPPGRLRLAGPPGCCSIGSGRERRARLIPAGNAGQTDAPGRVWRGPCHGGGQGHPEAPSSAPLASRAQVRVRAEPPQPRSGRSGAGRGRRLFCEYWRLRQSLSQREQQKQSNCEELLWVGIAIFLPFFSFSSYALMLLPGEWLVLSTTT